MRHCFDFEVAAEPSAEDVATKDYAPFLSLSSRDTWMCAVLNNEFLRLLDASADDGSALQPALEAWLTIFDDCLASTNKPQLESMVSVLRGLLALLSPVPGHLGSAIADVEFVYPATLRSPPIYSDVPRLGKLVAQTLRAKEVWATRADYYKKHQGAEVKHTTSFRDLYLLGDTVGAGVRAGTTSHTETDSYIHEFCSRVPQFKQSLRIGATAPLEQQAFLIIKHLWEQGGGGGGTGSSTDIATLRDALAMITCRSADKLLHDILDRLGAVEEEEAAHGLERISRMVDAEACTNDEMKTLSSALARCESSAKKPTLMKLLHAAVTNSFVAAAKLLWQSTLSDEAEFAQCDGFLSAWDEISQRFGNLNLGQQVTTARVLVSRFLKAQTKLAELAEAREGRASEVALDRACDTVEKMVQTAATKFPLHPVPAWALQMQDACKSLQALVLTPLREVAVHIAQAKVDSVLLASAALSAIAGGDKNSQVWSDSKPLDMPLLVHFDKTLDKSDTEKIQAAIDALERSVQALQATDAKYKHLGVVVEASTIDNASMALARGCQTRCELKCCRVLRKSNNKKGRLQSYTTEFSSKTGKNWREELPADLVDLIDRACAQG